MTPDASPPVGTQACGCVVGTTFSIPCAAHPESGFGRATPASGETGERCECGQPMTWWVNIRNSLHARGCPMYAVLTDVADETVRAFAAQLDNQRIDANVWFPRKLANAVLDRLTRIPSAPVAPSERPEPLEVGWLEGVLGEFASRYNADENAGDGAAEYAKFIARRIRADAGREDTVAGERDAELAVAVDHIMRIGFWDGVCRDGSLQFLRNAHKRAMDVLTVGLRASLPVAAEPNIEHLAEAVHEAYLTTCARLGWQVKPENAVPYSELSETSKELDRASVRAVLSHAAPVVVAGTGERERDMAELQRVRGAMWLIRPDRSRGSDFVDGFEDAVGLIIRAAKNKPHGPVSRQEAAALAAPAPAPGIEMTKDWCMEMAKAETGHEIGAGVPTKFDLPPRRIVQDVNDEDAAAPAPVVAPEDT